jgi:hypothetical protein
MPIFSPKEFSNKKKVWYDSPQKVRRNRLMKKSPTMEVCHTLEPKRPRPCLATPDAEEKFDIPHIHFCNGTPAQHEFVLRVASEWFTIPTSVQKMRFLSNYKIEKLLQRRLPISFKVAPLGTARVRITFGDFNVCTYIGGFLDPCREDCCQTNHLIYSGAIDTERITEMTLHLADNPEILTGDALAWARYIVLHEFGHALEMKHETRKAGAYKLDETAVRQTVGNDATADTILGNYHTSIVRSNHYCGPDPETIMEYPLDPNWIENQDDLVDHPIPFSSAGPIRNELSVGDHIWILNKYGHD